MSFDPSKNEPWSNLFGKNPGQPKPSVFDMFGSEKRDFEPIDDDEDDDVAPPPNKPDLAAEVPAESSPVDDSRPGQAARTPAKSTNKSNNPRQSQPPQLAMEASNEKEPEKTKMSHWDMLASALGLTRNKNKPAAEPEVGKSPADASPTAKKPERPTSPKLPMAEAINSPTVNPPAANPIGKADESDVLSDLFVPSGKKFDEHPRPKRMVDDVTFDDAFVDELEELDVEDAFESEGSAEYIEFVVEELNPRGAERTRNDRTGKAAGRESHRASLKNEADFTPEDSEDIESREPKSEGGRGRRRRGRRGQRSEKAPFEQSPLLDAAAIDDFEEVAPVEAIDDLDEPLDPVETRPSRNSRRRRRGNRNDPRRAREGEVAESDAIDAELDEAFDDEPFVEEIVEERPRGRRPTRESSVPKQELGDDQRKPASTSSRNRDEDRGRGERPRGERPRGERPRGERARGERAGGERPQEEIAREAGSRDERPRGQAARGERPRVENSAGENVRSERPRGERARGERTPPPESRDSARREALPAKKRVPPPATSRVDDDDDDFIQIDDHSRDGKKQITTWNEAISAIIEKNIDAHGKSKGKPRGRQSDNRRRR